jgi:hypothetical protein
MALSDRLMDNLRVNLPGATDNAIRIELWNMLDDFCRGSWAWRETIAVTLIAGETEYQITPPGTEIVHAFSVDHATLNVNGASFEFDTLSLPNAPSASDALTPAYVIAALVPALSEGADIENLIPADMWSKWHQAFLSGTLARMMAQPAKPYSNPQLAAYHQRCYRPDRAEARRDAATNGVQGAQTWRFPRFA